ncbi:MAG: lipocalin-like domain-containing protein [Acidobacteriota bacterium]
MMKKLLTILGVPVLCVAGFAVAQIGSSRLAKFTRPLPQAVLTNYPAASTDRADKLPTSERASFNADGWREASSNYNYSFPRDHASHSDYKIEWWYYTGNLESKTGRRFGYQLTFFRSGVVMQTANPSRWAVRDLYMTHFCISDIENQKFYSFERLNRAGVGWAGADTNSYRVWNEDWQARLDGNTHVLDAERENYKLALQLTPEKTEIIHGENAISQKGAQVGNASHYVSLTRMRTTGTITVDGETFDLTGLSWMDHEFGTSFLEENQIGWDWFSIQLDDRRELMLFQIRRKDGSIDQHSSGTLIDADGRATRIAFGEFTLKPTGTNWSSQVSQATYPTEWLIEIPKLELRLTVRAAFGNQELQTTESTGVTYWEGSVSIEGTSRAQVVGGRGYLEMTGYAGQNMGAIFQ